MLKGPTLLVEEEQQGHQLQRGSCLRGFHHGVVERRRCHAMPSTAWSVPLLFYVFSPSFLYVAFLEVMVGEGK